MKISDRDKKLILFVILAAIIALPIFFFIRPKNEKIKELDSELVSINERYAYLKELSALQPEYEAKIDQLNKERDEFINGFAKGIKLENTIMFLRAVELSDKPVSMSSISFGGNEETPVTADSVDENGNFVPGLTALRSDTAVAYSAEYSDIKDFLDYIFNYKDKMAVSSINMTLDTVNNKIDGTFTLTQFAITGEGREVESTKIPAMSLGTDRVFPLILDEDGEPLQSEEITLEEEAEVSDNVEEVLE